MEFIDEKFKDRSPVETVNRIKDILKNLDIEVYEEWNDSGIDNCWSLNLRASGGSPYSNGKGVTKELAQASAYGEFIERLQCGLFLYKYQSIDTDPEINMHYYAHDKKYMTTQELINNGEWMDHIINTYKNGLSRIKLAAQCKLYACTNEEKILTLPFYSIFEKKQVYLPVGFLQHIYASNGCCVGNTEEEALVHAFSEISERKHDIDLLISGKCAPIIPREILNRYPIISKILSKIDETNKYDVCVFNLSSDDELHVVSTRIINKETQGYIVNTAADPILEIAIQRTLTEIFQGRNLKTFNSAHNGVILNTINDYPIAHNIMNLVENGNGQYCIDFFVDKEYDYKVKTDYDVIPSNKELLNRVIKKFKDLNKPVYIRNFSFLDFPCYLVIIPGYSEFRPYNLIAPVQEYALGSEAAKVIKNPLDASPDQLLTLLMYNKQIQTAYGRKNNFPRLAGIPIKRDINNKYLHITLAYAAYRLNNKPEVEKHLINLLKNTNLSQEETMYFRCVKQYLNLLSKKLSQDEIQQILYKFHKKEHVTSLLHNLKECYTPFDPYLFSCQNDCNSCKHQESCNYSNIKAMIKKAGKLYSKFKDSQKFELLV